jgi:NAD(P)-dependent dehydrogenase (short-subunit alcohol dehydrogenase family)
MTARAGRYAGRTVMITGAAGGFGSLAAARFAAEGASLVLGDREQAMLEGVVQRHALDADRVALVAGDISREETAVAMVEAAIARFGALDVAINNAGIAHPLQRLTETDAAVMREILAINVMGVFHCMRAQIAVMQERYRSEGVGGAILNVASVAGIVGAPLLAAYSAGKHAVVGLTKSAALETAKRGLRINALCPSFAKTAMVDEIVTAMRGERDEALARLVGSVPMGRAAEAEEIVQAMLWACSEENSFMTGQTIALDGGLSAG